MADTPIVYISVLQFEFYCLVTPSFTWLSGTGIVKKIILDNHGLTVLLLPFVEHLKMRFVLDTADMLFLCSSRGNFSRRL